MSNSFQITPLPYEQFAPFFAMSDPELRTLGMRRMTVEEKPGFPCRVSLVDAEVGETVLLLPFAHHDVASPYRASGPIFIRKNAGTARPAVGEIPVMLGHRLLSVRAYDVAATMVNAEVEHGSGLKNVIRRLFSDEHVSYLHVHNASAGCFNCRVDRA